jgi:hypothetical protein
VTAFNDSVVGLGHLKGGAELLRDLRADIRAVPGMARFDHSSDMVYHADRPAEAVYDRISNDSRLPTSVRHSAGIAEGAVGALVLAHAESSWFAEFHATYADAAGPTVHVPLSPGQYDPWSGGGVSETHNGFFGAVHGRDFARAIGAYSASDDRAVLVA